MSRRPHAPGPVPEGTARVARAACPKGNVSMQMRDVLGVVYDAARLAPLVATRGRPAEAPWRLALVTVMQFAERLSDRPAAEAVRARLGWQDALGWEVAAPGCDFSGRSEFRGRLVDGSAEQLLLEAPLTAGTAGGSLTARGRHRADSSPGLGARRGLNRLACVAETRRAARNAVAEAAPDWRRARAPAEWDARYGRRIEEYRLPRGRAARPADAEPVGTDGLRLPEAVWAPTAPADGRRRAAVELLRRTWVRQDVAVDDHPRVRDPQDLPPAATELESPSEPEARAGAQRGMSWIGYQVHLTATGDAELPHPVARVSTTIATDADLEPLAASQAGLARVELLPAQQLVDAGSSRGRDLGASARAPRIAPVGPLPEDHRWQAKAKQGCDLAPCRVDWAAQVVPCPPGRPSARRGATRTARDRTMGHVAVAPEDCTPCPVRACCPRAGTLPRSLLLQERAEHEAIQAARQRQPTAEFAAASARRAGVAGTLAQASRAGGWAAPSPLPRPRHGPSAARRHRGRDQRRAPHHLAQRRSPRGDPPRPLRRPGPSEVIRDRIRQRYLAGTLPLLEKEAPPCLLGVWDGARQALSTSSIWLVCGYSLPQYDRAITHLLADAASAGAADEIVLMDPYATAIAERWQAVAPRARLALLPGLPEALGPLQKL